KLVLVDACRNDVKADSSARNVDVNKVTIPDGVGVLFSCKSGERAYETGKLGGGHGVFFYNVLEGLEGEGKDDKGAGTWDRLLAYVKEEVEEQVPKLIGGGARQTPHGISNLAGATVLSRVAAGSRVGAEQVTRAWDKEITAQIARGVQMRLMRIPAGRFKMGSPPSEPEREVL